MRWFTEIAGTEFMSLKILNIRDVAESRMCCGCGLCAYISPKEIQMVDAMDQGRRPIVTPLEPCDARTDEALKTCPGIELEHTFPNSPELISELTDAWGPVYELWEGHAADEEIRFAGSSGGAASALALFALERQGFHGVLHTSARNDVPYLNETVISHTRDELLNRAGSRYAPASPCDGLQKIEDAPGPCVFIGKPCDVAGAQRARRVRPGLDARLGLTIAFFCAGTPSTKGTIEMLKRMGVPDPDRLISLRYRGNGWPGKATAVFRDNDGAEATSQLTYSQSWGEILQKHRQWRCQLCVDHTGEFADIAVGDPWYQGVPDEAPGRSLILARTERGRSFLAAARDAGYVQASPAEAWKLPASQEAFRPLRGKVWARIWALWLLGAPVPRYRRMPMARYWWTDLGWADKVKSFVGTIRRFYRRHLNQRATIKPLQPVSGVTAASQVTNAVMTETDQALVKPTRR